MTTKHLQHKAKAIIFARVSTKDQQDGHSLDAQIQHCYKYAIDNDFSVLETFKIIESATKSKRPEFAKMVNFIRKHKEKIVVLVYNTDRLQRNFDEQALILHGLVKEDRAEIHYTFSGQIINSKADSSTKFRHGLDVLLASDYANKISDNVLRSINKKLEDGTILGPAPIGYLNKERKHFNGQNKHKREQAHVFIDPVRGEIIKKVFEDYATGVLSMKQVLAKALKAGLKGKIKNAEPRVGTIERILSNPFYYGAMKYNGALYPHPYEPLITKELWDICQDVRDGKRRHKVKTPKSGVKHAYSGLVTCKHCECMYSPEIHINKNTGGKYYYLRPTKSQGECKHCDYIREDIVDEQIMNVIQEIKIPDDMLQILQSDLKKFIKINMTDRQKEYKELCIKKANIKELMDQNLNDRVDKSITQDEFNEMNKSLKVKLVQIETQLDSFTEGDIILSDAVISIFEVANNADTYFLNSDNEKKQQILKLLFPKLELDGSNLCISLRKPFDMMLKNEPNCEWLPGRDSNPRPIG